MGLSGKTTSSRDGQSLNAQYPISSMLSGRTTDLRFVHSAKAQSPICFSVDGNLMLLMELHPLKASSVMEVTPSGKTISTISPLYVTRLHPVSVCIITFCFVSTNLSSTNILRIVTSIIFSLQKLIALCCVCSRETVLIYVINVFVFSLVYWRLLLIRFLNSSTIFG